MGYEMEDFRRDVIERSRTIPVLVDFWAAWCGPCKVLGPILERLAEQHAGRWALVKLDTERHPDLARRYGIQGIPNVKLFVDGEVVDEFVGALPEYAVVQWLRKALPSPHRERLEQAKRWMAAQKMAEAQACLEEITAAEPENDQATVLLAQTFLDTAPRHAMEIAARIEPDSEYADLAEAVRTFGRLFQYVDDPSALPQGRSRARYLEAIRHLQANRIEDALTGFIEVIRQDRHYDDDGARKACIGIFRFLGEGHDITKRHRPAFSSAVHA